MEKYLLCNVMVIIIIVIIILQMCVVIKIINMPSSSANQLMMYKIIIDFNFKFRLNIFKLEVVLNIS